MTDVQKLSILLLPYFTICGALYHIAYWSQFDINGLQYISITDVIKGAVQPVLPVFIWTMTCAFFTFFIKGPKKDASRGKYRDTKIGIAMNSKLGIWIALSIWLGIVISLYLIDNNVYRWTGWAGITGIPFWMFLLNMSIFEKQIPDTRIRVVTLITIVQLPIFSFAIGKQNSELNYKNLSYQYTCVPKLNTNGKISQDTLKFIGIADNKIFLTDLKNKKVTMIKSDQDSLILYKFEKK